MAPTQAGDRSKSNVIIIRPRAGWVPIDFAALWAYRELLYFIIWREIKVRYKQTALGFIWAMMQPFFMMVVFSLFFGHLAKMPSEGIAYPLFTYAALLPWTLFSEGITRSSMSIVQDAGLIQKIYLPRLIMPITGVVSPLVDFGIAFTILLGMVFYYGYVPSLSWFLLPAFILLALMTALAVGLWLSVINVTYRDVRYAIPFFVQLWFFGSPVVYPSSLVPPQAQILYGLNPMAGVIEGFRWALLGTKPPGLLIAISICIIIALLISGAFFFRRHEKTFADRI
ncbi:MAG: ABC transporter permease [Chloroflexi bacterium]|nr:ABC transporter permease [Chloroflexota bacterium]